MDDRFSEFRLFYEMNKDKFPEDFRGTVEASPRPSPKERVSGRYCVINLKITRGLLRSQSLPRNDGNN